MSRILIVLSAASVWIRADGSKYDSGVWAEELVVMHETFVRAGCDVDISTPGGVAPTIDPHSMNVVKDGNLLSGQNPASTAPLAEAVLAALA